MGDGLGRAPVESLLHARRVCKEKWELRDGPPGTFPAILLAMALVCTYLATTVEIGTVPWIGRFVGAWFLVWAVLAVVVGFPLSWWANWRRAGDLEEIDRQIAAAISEDGLSAPDRVGLADVDYRTRPFVLPNPWLRLATRYGVADGEVFVQSSVLGVPFGRRPRVPASRVIGTFPTGALWGDLIFKDETGEAAVWHNVFRPNEQLRRVRQVLAVHSAATQVLTAEPAARRRERPCPFCAESVLIEAKPCKHCHQAIAPVPA